ncbi:MAG TPA: hypothetical protein VJ732_06180 [Bryobacteraceae bacterium]|nr:hypothetical protein [Bryobacteraceae bacterium]
MKDRVAAIRIESTGPDTLSIVFECAHKSGENLHEEITEICDGQEHARNENGSRAGGRTDICQQVDDSTIRITQKANGKLVAENLFPGVVKTALP